MAFLKETERSLRLYFIIVGVLGTLIALSSLRDVSQAPPIPSILVALALWLPPLARLVLSVAFVVAGIKLKQSLENGAPRTMLMVKVAAAVVIGEVLLYTVAVTSVGGDTAYLAGWAVGRGVVPLLILWYIHSSLRRLADESRRRIVNTVADKFV
jgi:hypothetical protein